MPTDSDPGETIVQRLLRARAGGPPADDSACQGLVTSVEQAYAIQDRLYQALGNPPGVPRYWKSGGASRAEPMRHAPLPVAGVRPAAASVSDLRLHQRWIEAEVALRLGRDVTPEDAREIGFENSAALVDAMGVSIEVVDFRWAAARNAAPLLKLADLLVHGALVLGEFVPFEPPAWAQQACRVRVGAAAWRPFVGSLGVGDPAWVLPDWLRHLTRDGATVPAGTVVSTGSWCGLLEAGAGDEVVAEFPGIGVASVRF